MRPDRLQDRRRVRTGSARLAVAETLVRRLVRTMPGNRVALVQAEGALRRCSLDGSHRSRVFARNMADGDAAVVRTYTATDVDECTNDITTVLVQVSWGSEATIRRCTIYAGTSAS